MRNHTYLLDHHQRSRHDTITIGPERMMNWALQLNNSQSVNSFNSLVEKFNVLKLSKPTQSKPKPIRDRSGKPEDTEHVFVDKGKTSRSHEIDEKGLHEELGSSDRSGKPDKLSENIRVKHAHDGTGEPVKSSASTHIVKEQFAPEENRDIASFNADNEFNRAINKEDIDFNIPGVPNSTVKRSHGVNVQNLIQKIENHPQRHALQSDLQQHRQFNPFSKESQEVIEAAGNTELCELLDMQPKAPLVIHVHVRTSLTRLSLSTSTCSSLSPFSSTSCTPSCTLSSTTRSSWKACATPPTRRVRTPTTSPPPSQKVRSHVPSTRRFLLSNSCHLGVDWASGNQWAGRRCVKPHGRKFGC